MRLTLPGAGSGVKHFRTTRRTEPDMNTIYLNEAHLAYSRLPIACPCCRGRGWIYTAPYLNHLDEGEKDVCPECDGHGETPAPPIGDWVASEEADMKEVDAHVDLRSAPSL